MSWVKLDDHFDENAKVAAAGPLGIALYVTGLAYCNRNLTDGFIPWATARSLLTWEYLGAVEDDGRQKHYRIAYTTGMQGDDVDAEHVVDRLLEAGLWEEAPGGYRVHDYDQYQPSKAEVEAGRMTQHDAKAAGGKARAAGAVRDAGRFTSAPASSAPADAPAAHQHVTSPDPDPDPDPDPNPDPDPIIPNPTDSVPLTRARAKPGVKAKPAITEEDRRRFHVKYAPVAKSIEEIDFQIDLALAHDAAKKSSRHDLYVQNWLNRAFSLGANGERTTGGGAGVTGRQPDRGPYRPGGLAAGGGRPGAASNGFGVAPAGSLRADSDARDVAAVPGAQPPGGGAGGDARGGAGARASLG